MSKEKQIEEMAKICTDKCKDCHNSECRESTKSQYCIADKLYNAGYRKQSEGEWEGNGYLLNCSECGNVVNFNNVSRWLYNFCPNCGARMKGGA